MKTVTAVYHRADFDGIFCREIAKKFLPKDSTEFIGWDFADPPLKFPESGMVYVMDLPLDRPFDPSTPVAPGRLVWIDHHKSAIESHPKDIAGLRIDGVAACRLAWQWFSSKGEPSFISALKLRHFVERMVTEPLAVRLAGEYDIFDRRDPNAATFQLGLRSDELDELTWDTLLRESGNGGATMIDVLLEAGENIEGYRKQEYRDVITQQGFDVEWEGIKFLACNTHVADLRSQLFEAGMKAHHQAMLGFTYMGKAWKVSMYGPDNSPLDLSAIAVKYGGGGHRLACGFITKDLPFGEDVSL